MKWLAECGCQDATVAGQRVRRGVATEVECTEAEARRAERCHHGLRLTLLGEAEPVAAPEPEVPPIGDESVDAAEDTE